MIESGKTVKDFDPIFIRDSLVKMKLDFTQAYFSKMHWTNRSYPYVSAKIDALTEIRSLSSRQDFESKLEVLGKEHFNLRMNEREDEAGLISEHISETQAVYEGLRFFWGDKSQLKLGSLFSVQRAVKYPVWSDDWKFQEQSKPPHVFSVDYGRLNDFYQRLEEGSLVRICPDIVKERNLNKGISGEVLGFTMGLRASWDMDFLIVSYKDQENWLHQRYLHQLELDLNQT